MNVSKMILGLILVTSLVSCGTFKPASKYYQNSLVTDIAPTKNEPQFLSVKPVSHGKIITSPVASSTSKVEIEEKEPVHISTKVFSEETYSDVNAEKFDLKQIKYAIILDVPVESITNKELYNFIEEWYGTRYVFGGTSRRGIDCSSLMQKIYTQVFSKEIPRTAVNQHRETERILKSDLQEGDLIFFHTTRSGISHVGLYLGNDRFIHASSSKGVTISNLNDKYYTNAYRACGRVTEATKGD
jgi:cell wall-associated NlpC family hydrolase